MTGLCSINASGQKVGSRDLDMMRDMLRWCFGPDGKRDFHKMTQFMEEHDRASKFDAAGWALLFIWVGISWLADVGRGLALLGVAVTQMK